MAVTQMQSRPPIPEMLKKLTFQEANSECAFCGIRDISTLEIHHIQPYGVVQCHQRGNLIVTCANCHKKIAYGEIPQSAVFQRKRELRFEAGMRALDSGLVPDIDSDIISLSLSKSFAKLVPFPVGEFRVVHMF